MPVYEFKCMKCGQVFEVAMTMSEADSVMVTCPVCTSEDVQKQFSPFSAVTTKKS